MFKLNKLIIVFTLLCITIGHTDRWTTIIGDMRTVIGEPPVMVMNSTGGYFAIWEERNIEPETNNQYRHYYYRLINTAGEHIVSKISLDDWYVPAGRIYPQNVRFSANSITWLNPDRLLILGWKQIFHDQKLVRIIIDGAGKIIKQDTDKKTESLSSWSKLAKTEQSISCRSRLWL